MSDVSLLEALKSMSASEILREVLGKQFNGSHNGLWPNSPEHAPPFRPDASVPNPKVARMLEELLRIAPEARGATKRVLVGPTAASMDLMSKSKLPIDSFEKTDLGGIYQNGEIGLNPLYYQLHQPGLFGFLAHELAHSVGYDDPIAYPTGDTAERLYRETTLKQHSGSTPMNYPFREGQR